MARLPGLHFLALHSNKISKALQVVLLSHLAELKHLTLCGNPVCKQQDWQLATLALLPTLQVSFDQLSSLMALHPMQATFLHMGSIPNKTMERSTDPLPGSAYAAAFRAV